MVGEWVAVQPGQVAEQDEVEEDNEEKTLQAMQVGSRVVCLMFNTIYSFRHLVFTHTIVT